MAISQSEKPYDVFICYKETDENGQRTHDSQWAQDVYYGLTEQGYKVFFSRISLEDKLGQQYEPYIFAALNSARVMVVIGSKPEHFNAVWVKNEWSRYLALMKTDRKRLLIPCYRGMDPYDLPDELSSLQSQDMSRIGFMQDLIRGVKKVLDAEKKPQQVAPARAAAQPAADAAVAAPGVSSLIRRARLFMEDGDFASAREYIDRVLDIDPEYAPAYAARTCAALGLRHEEELGDATFLYDDNADWQKALRFADETQRAVYEGYAEKARRRVEQQIHTFAMDNATRMAVNGGDRADFDRALEEYKNACGRSGDAANRPDGKREPFAADNDRILATRIKNNDPDEVSEAALKDAAAMFEAAGGDEARSRARACLSLAETARKKARYFHADFCEKRARGLPSELDIAAECFMEAEDYSDAAARADACRRTAKQARSALYQQARKGMAEAGNDSKNWQKARELLKDTELNGYRDIDALRAQAQARYDECVAAERESRRQADERLRREAERQKRRKIVVRVIVSAIVVLAIAAYFVVTKVIMPAQAYEHAVALRQEGHYEEAVAAFTELGNYSDAAEQVGATYYAQGEALREAGNWDGAVEAFRNAGDYEDATTQIYATRYAEGEAKRSRGDWAGAIRAFEAAGSYNDAATQVNATYYAEGEAKRDAGEWDGALTAFKKAGAYGDAAEQIKAIYAHYYAEGERLRENGDWDGAVNAFRKAARAYSDAATQINATYYAQGEALRESGDWDGAVDAFKNAGAYSDAATQINATRYEQGEALRDAGDWDGAIGAFKKAGNYSDAATQINATYYAQGEALREIGDWDGAVKAFENAGEYSDASTQITETHYQHAQALMDQGDYDQAYAILTGISGYKDVDTLLATDNNLLAVAARDAAFSVGNYVTFGHYPQTASCSDSTPIEWLVLARDGNRALLISRYGLDAQPYNTQYTSVTWEKCTLRTWLNGTLMDRAFTANEQSAILLTNVDNSNSHGYSGYSTSGGNNTQDRIFLLSYAEANRYLGVTYDDSNNTRSRVAPTAYAIAQGAWKSSLSKTADGDAAGWWWLRSPGLNQSSAGSVGDGGSLYSYNVRSGNGVVRPALWVNLDSGIF